MARSWHTCEPRRLAIHVGQDHFVGGGNPARADLAMRELIKILARELAVEDHLAETDNREYQ